MSTAFKKLCSFYIRKKLPLCKEDSPIRGNVVEDDKRVAKVSAKQTEGL